MTTTTTPELIVAPEVEGHTTTLTMAADIGNARAFFAVATEQGVKEIAIPAVRSLHGVSAFEVFERRRWPVGAWAKLAPYEHIMSVNGIDRFLGQLAIDFAPAAGSGRGSDRRYSDGTTRDFLLAAAAAAAPKATDITVQLATLLPISLWSRHASEVAESLKGKYTYTYNGREVTLRIASVEVLREGEAAFGALQPRPTGRHLLIDGGGRTVNVALFDKGEYVKGATIDNMGVEAALDAVDKELAAHGFAPLGFGGRMALQDTLLHAGEAFYVHEGGTKIRVDTLARKHFDAAATALVQELRARVAVEMAESGTFVGGAAYPAFFGSVVAELLPVVTLAERPETMNAYGALAALVGQPVKKGKRR